MSYSQQDRSLLGGGLGSLASGIASFFGGGGKNNPAFSANQFISQIPGSVGKYYDPYINAGKGSIPTLQEQYNALLTNPGDKLNQFGLGYKQSPGFQFKLDQALQAAQHQAAAGGMAGSPAAQQRSMEVAEGIANQDYNDYLHNVLGLYGQGLSGEQGLYTGGLGASRSMADQIAQTLAQQAAYAYEQQAQKNKQESSGLGDILGGLGSILSMFI